MSNTISTLLIVYVILGLAVAGELAARERASGRYEPLTIFPVLALGWPIVVAIDAGGE